MKFLVKIMLLIYMCMQAAIAAEVVLDAGHGGKDPGAVRYLNGKLYKEKDIALDVAKHTQRELLAKGYDVAMTRTSDIYLELDNRRAQSIFLCEKLFMSIHADAHKNPQAKGGTVLVHRLADESSWQAANVVRNAIKSKRRARSQAIRVLRNQHKKCASILVEVGFMSNPEEMAQLADAAYRRQMGKQLAHAAMQYVGAPSKKAAAAKSAPQPRKNPTVARQNPKTTENTVKVAVKKSPNPSNGKTGLTPSRQSVSKTASSDAKKTTVKKETVKKETVKSATLIVKQETVKKETSSKTVVQKNTVKEKDKNTTKHVVQKNKNNGQAA